MKLTIFPIAYQESIVEWVRRNYRLIPYYYIGECNLQYFKRVYLTNIKAAWVS